MKRISLWVLIFTFAACAVRAQDAAAQQQIDKLSGQIQDLLEAQAQNGKRLDALQREISELRDKVNTPQVNDSASRSDLRSLAEKVQEIDRKRVEDSEHISEQIKMLGKVIATAPAPVSRKPAPKPPVEDTTTPAVPQKGYDYVVKPGDTLALIAQAYRDQGVKVTRAQIKAANPKINFDVLLPGKKIFIPDANAK
jgi:LysM repeat protein